MQRGVRPVDVAGNLEAKAPKEILFRWLLALGCFVVLLVFFSPAWGAFRAWARAPEMGFMIETRRGAVVLDQMAHPGAPVTDTLHAAVQWRLLFPLIGRMLHLPPAVLFGLADAGCVAVLAFIITVLRRRGAGWADAALAALILGAGSWYFASVCWLGYFDSWLALGLLLVGFARSPRTVWLACLWAPWVDERFVLGAPLALWCRFALRPGETAAESLAAWVKREALIPAALLAGFVGLRLGILRGQSAPGATIAGYWRNLQFGEGAGGRVALGIWDGLRAGWLFVAAALLAGATSRRQAGLLGGMTVALVLAGLLTAQDFSRAMTLVLPVGLLGALRLVELGPSWWRPVGWLGAVAALLVPAHLVMSNYTQPIHRLDQEWAALRDPPAVLRAETYEERARQAVERRDFSQAELDLTLAIKLADNPARPSEQRGIFYATGRHWAEARRDFDTAVKFAPEDPDAWFLRAQAALALGDVPAARADFQQALAVGSPEWSARPEVIRVRGRLEQTK